VIPGRGLWDDLVEGGVAVVATTGAALGVGWLRTTRKGVYRLRAELMTERDELDREVQQRKAAEREARHRQ